MHEHAYKSNPKLSKAIKSYQDAMKIYPTMNSGKIMIKRIKELIKKQSI